MISTYRLFTKCLRSSPCGTAPLMYRHIKRTYIPTSKTYVTTFQTDLLGGGVDVEEFLARRDRARSCAYIYIYTQICTCIFKLIFIYMYIYIYTYIHIHTCHITCTHMYAHTYIYICMHISIHICINRTCSAGA